MKQSLIYSTKVWITTVILGMRIVGLIRIAMDTDHLIYSAKDIFTSAIYDIPIGFITCLPSWLLFSIIVRYVNGKNFLLIYKKALLTLTVIFLTILPFALLFWHQLVHPNYWPDMLPDLIGYITVTIAGIWFYKLEPLGTIYTDVIQSPK